MTLQSRPQTSRRRQAGMTLTEPWLGLGVGAAVAVIAYGGYKMATNMVSVDSQVQATTQMAAAITRVFGMSNDYTQVKPENVIDGKLVPSGFKADSAAKKITNKWGGDVTPAVGDQAGASPTTVFKITITGVPKEQCVDFVRGISSAATVSLWVNGTTKGTHDVKDTDGKFYPDRATKQCEAGPGNIILVAN
ncbi:MAG: type 4 pilus major pilin [Gammaproteobacteria bacterium]|nr:type 4 pilus major pilin [Gammaproteobacteria bacterium]